MIKLDLLQQTIFETIRRASTIIPNDVKNAFKKAIKIESSKNAKTGLQNTLQSIKLSEIMDSPLCPDTGWPIFFFKIGNDCKIDGGVLSIEKTAEKAVIQATEFGYLRKTMKHPISGFDPGNNIGLNIPDYTYKFVPGNEIEITFVPKGGGSECFGGTRYKVIAFADGITGIKKFIIDSFVDSTRTGAICPPSILGVGIGGTANMVANLAKQATCLRLIGSKNPDIAMAQLEEELLSRINRLGIGIMGIGGETSVFAVNIEFSFTHLAGITCATSSNCMIVRRATTRIKANSSVEIINNPLWFGGR